MKSKGHRNFGSATELNFSTSWSRHKSLHSFQYVFDKYSQTLFSLFCDPRLQVTFQENILEFSSEKQCGHSFHISNIEAANNCSCLQLSPTLDCPDYNLHISEKIALKNFNDKAFN